MHQEPFTPFSAWETVLSVPRWAVGAGHLGAWLLVFSLLDKTVIPGRRFDRLGKFVCRRVTGLAGIEVVQHGLHHLDGAPSHVFCVNHVSLFDLFVVFQSIPRFHRSFQSVAHFDIPIYGSIIRVFGQLPVDRGDKELNRRSFARAVEMLHAGESFVVFPEGHRTRDGRLGQFYPGAFRLAREARVSVVPMALRGLRNLCPAGDWRVRPGRVDVLFGAPIPPRDDLDGLAHDARAALDGLLARGPAPG